MQLLRRALFVPLLALAVLASSAVLAPPATAASAQSILLSKINATRKAHGLQPLRMKADLNKAAAAQSRSMYARGSLYHSNLGRLCCFRAAAENVGYGAGPNAVQAMFMASPAHRANVLGRGYDEIGIGFYSRNGRLWVTEIFRDRR